MPAFDSTGPAYFVPGSQGNDMKRIRAVFLDIDGTLMSIRRHAIPESARAAVAAARASGVLIFLCTSRARQFLTNVGGIGYDGLVCLTGAHCTDAAGRDIHCEQMHWRDILQSVRYVQRAGLPYIALAPDRIFAEQSDRPEVMHALDVGGLRPQDVAGGFSLFDDFRDERPDDEARVKAMNILQVTGFFPSGPEERAFMAMMPHSHAQRWTEDFVDIVSDTVDKALGMEVLGRHFGFGLDETMAVGDGANDLPMLRRAAVGVAMGNAPDEVKRHVGFVTSDVDEDGLARALERFL